MITYSCSSEIAYSPLKAQCRLLISRKIFLNWVNLSHLPSITFIYSLSYLFNKYLLSIYDVFGHMQGVGVSKINYVSSNVNYPQARKTPTCKQTIAKRYENFCNVILEIVWYYIKIIGISFRIHKKWYKSLYLNRGRKFLHSWWRKLKVNSR